MRLPLTEKLTGWLRRSRDDLMGRRYIGSLLERAVLSHHRAAFRRAWIQAAHPPHFIDHRYVMTEITYGNLGAAPLNRAFFTAEIVRAGDRLLDIGCGDGFADRHFYGERCSHIDAIDVEPAAVAAARHYHAADNITFHLADAVVEPFPSRTYDVIVWDGAIGHFPSDATDRMLDKIREALSIDGVFSGSESLGRVEGQYDHLRFFDDLDDLAHMLGRVFPYVRVRKEEYGLPDGTKRREGYWRCALTESRLGSPWVGSTSRRMAP